MKKMISALSFFIILSSCENAQEKAFETLNEEVMSLHDNIMPKTEDLVTLKSKLDSLSKGPDSIHVKRIQIALAKADESMMDWMHQYSLDSLEKMSIEDKISYLRNQIGQLQSIEKLTDSTISAAHQYVK